MSFYIPVFLPGQRAGDMSDLSELEEAQCAFISDQHGKQTQTDLFPSFTLLLIIRFQIMA